MNSTGTSQASEDELNNMLIEVRHGRMSNTKALTIVRAEKLKLLDEVIHQSTINLKSAKAVAGWAELRKEQLEAEL